MAVAERTGRRGARGTARALLLSLLLVLAGGLGCPEPEPEPEREPGHDGGDAAAARAPSATPEGEAGVGPGTPAAPRAVVRIEIEERGRARIPRAALAGADAILIELGLTDDAPGEARAVRVVSVDGRRLEAVAAAREGTPGRFVVEVAPDFLRAGLYMIEADARDAHPIDLRRYVLTVEP